MNINFTDLEKLIRLAERSDINALEVTDGGARISIACQPNSNKNSQQAVNHTNNNAGQPLDTSSAASRKPQTAESTNVQTSNESVDEQVTTEEIKSQVSAPMLGTFYRRSEPAADEFASVGDQVEAGQTLCIIEAMKMMHEVQADVPCTIKEVLVTEGDIVEYGQALFIIEPNS